MKRFIYNLLLLITPGVDPRINLYMAMLRLAEERNRYLLGLLNQAREEARSWQVCANCEHADKLKMADDLAELRATVEKLVKKA